MKSLALLITFSAFIGGCAPNSDNIRALGNVLPLVYEAGKMCGKAREGVEKLEKVLDTVQCVDGLSEKYKRVDVASELGVLHSIDSPLRTLLGEYRQRRDEWCGVDGNKKFRSRTPQFEAVLDLQGKLEAFKEVVEPKLQAALDSISSKFQDHHLKLAESGDASAGTLFVDYLKCTK